MFCLEMIVAVNNVVCDQFDQDNEPQLTRAVIVPVPKPTVRHLGGREGGYIKRQPSDS